MGDGSQVTVPQAQGANLGPGAPVVCGEGGKWREPRPGDDPGLAQGVVIRREWRNGVATVTVDTNLSRNRWPSPVSGSNPRVTQNLNTPPSQATYVPPQPTAFGSGAFGSTQQHPTAHQENKFLKAIIALLIVERGGAAVLDATDIQNAGFSEQLRFEQLIDPAQLVIKVEPK